MVRKYTKKDQRGFGIYTEFVDTYGASVRIKQSSSISKRCWIYIEGGATAGTSSSNDGATHLNVVQAKMVIKALQKFLLDD